MTAPAQITFDAFALDPVNELLWKGSDRIRLRPKTFALLKMLAERPGQLVTKNDLLDAIWKDCNVGDEALKHCVAEIRRALNDDSEKPRYVETVHRRGYRFLGQTDAPNAAKATRPAAGGVSGVWPATGQRALVGRGPELAQLRYLLEKSREGARQVVFIAGDQGIGKTSLVDTFLDSVNCEFPRPNQEPQVRPLIARGQCIKSHGAGEAYMPFMEAFTGLAVKPLRQRVVALLQRYAPLWLSQMPSLVSATKWRRLQQTTMDATRERMMREMAEALEALTFGTPMILVLEDLHWGDYSSLDLISYWAQRRGVARLLLIATYRPEDIALNGHPLKTIKEELQARQQCHELQIPLLGDADVREYLEYRFPNNQFSEDIAGWIKQCTGGNPLFMINILNHLISRGLLTRQKGYWILNASLETASQLVPPTIQQVIERQIERCTPEEQELLKAASVEGVGFSVAGVAAAVKGRLARVSEIFQSLAKRNQFLQPASGENQASRYRFIHMLYQQTCYQLLSEELRMQFHRRIAEHIEKTDTSPVEFAARLAMHFDNGRDGRKALQYYLKAAENANARYAGHEALDMAARGLRWLPAAPEGPARIELEVSLQNALGTALMSARGLGIEEVKQAFTRSRDLFRTLSKRRQDAKRTLLFSALYGLWCYRWAHAEYTAAHDLAEQLLELAEAEDNPFMLNQAHYSLGSLLMDHGEFPGALEHLERSSNLLSRSVAAVTMWNLGYPDRALANIQQILSRALESGNPEHCIFAQSCTARVRMERREIEKTLEHAKLALDLAADQRLMEPWLAPIRSLYGWALVKLGQNQEGMDQMRQALEVVRAIGISNLKPLLLGIYADLLLGAGRIDEGLAIVEEALDSASSSGMDHASADLYRLKGELLLRKMPPENVFNPQDLQVTEAVSCFEQAIAVARKQQAKSLELRATVSLARLLERGENGQKEVYKRLQKIYSWFTEGFETADLREAGELLQERPGRLQPPEM
jgi:DNA-binding winged helix-turn-helix (wHTH) protein/tetratricopeptide (TPR) repeat protein